MRREVVSFIVVSLIAWFMTWLFVSSAQWVNPTTQHHARQERTR